MAITRIDKRRLFLFLKATICLMEHARKRRPKSSFVPCPVTGPEMGRDERGKKFEKQERGREREKLIISNSPGNFLWFFFASHFFRTGGRERREKIYDGS